MSQHSQPTPTDDDDPEFFDAVEQFPFSDSQHSTVSVSSISSSLHDINNKHNSVSSLHPHDDLNNNNNTNRNSVSSLHPHDDLNNNNNHNSFSSLHPHDLNNKNNHNSFSSLHPHDLNNNNNHNSFSSLHPHDLNNNNNTNHNSVSSVSSVHVHDLNNNNNHNSVSSVHDFNTKIHNTVSNLPEPPEPPSYPFASGLRHRKPFSKEFRFKNSSECFTDVTKTPPKGYKFLLNLNKTNLDRLLTKETDTNSLNSSALTEGETVNDINRSVTIGSDNSVSSGSNLIFTLIWLIVKVVSMKASLLVGVVTLPVWVTHACCMFVTNPLVVTARVKGHVMRSLLRLLEFCWGGVKRVVFKFIRRNKFVGRFCVKVGWGVLCSFFLGFVLVCLFGFAFVVGGVVMKCVVEAPVGRVARLNFDYTRDAPVAFVPLMSCSRSGCLGCDGKIGYGSVGVSRVIPFDRKVQATVSLTLPESSYNRNLGNFQVRVDYLSSNGKSLASATQPCTMRFKSRPIRLLMTLFKLAPLITGYLTESQTVDIKFNGYTERAIPTSCVRVVLEPRAEFAKGGGVPEIYTAYLKLESQLPFLKRILWSWKATVFVWTSIAIFKLFLVFLLLCCAPWLRLRGDAPVNNTGSR